MSNNPSCPQLRSDLERIKSLQQEFEAAFERAKETGDLKPVQALKARIEQKMAELKEKLWPFKELSRQELERQYQSQKEIFQRTGILERLSTGDLGLKAIDNQEYPFPEIQDIFKMMRENKEILKTKIEQGFTQLLITPFGMNLDDLTDKYRRTILKHHKEGKLFAAKKDPNNQNEPLAPLELNETDPIWQSSEYANADISGALVYDPKELPTTGEEPDAEKRKQRSQGKTKQAILSQDGAWTIQLTEDLPNIPRATEDEAEKQKRIKGGRPQLDTSGTSIKKYIEKGETTPSPQEYLKALQNDPIYQHEQGMTPEDQLTYAILHLEQTDQVIDDWQGNGSASYQTRAYLPASGFVPYARWVRDLRQALLGRLDPDFRGDNYGVRSGVRVKKLRI